MVTYEDGFDLIDHIRKHETAKNMPIIILTADVELNSKVQAFQLGADDLLTKPVDFLELEQRIYANLRRSGSYQIEEQIFDYQELHINLRSREVFLKKEKLILTNIEYKILMELISRKGEIINRERLVNKILTSKNSSVRTLDVHINSLRKKLGTYSSQIQTVRGRGYVFKPDAPSA